MKRWLGDIKKDADCNENSLIHQIKHQASKILASEFKHCSFKVHVYLTPQTSWDIQRRLRRTSHRIVSDDLDVDSPFYVLQLLEVNRGPARPAWAGLCGVHRDVLPAAFLRLDVKAFDLSVGRHWVLVKESNRDNHHFKSRLD